MRKYLLSILFTLLYYASYSQNQLLYLPTAESLKKRPSPVWFDEAKLGIMITWGLYSVPAWAEPIGEPGKFDWPYFYKHNPYAEWYYNTLRISGSSTQQYHEKTYGKNFSYYNFIKEFNKKTKKWDAYQMVEIFKNCGAKYLVLVTKHHDGFQLWPSKISSPFYQPFAMQAERDIVGELTSATKSKGLKMGLYYSGGLDWTFYQSPITNLWPDLFLSTPKSVAYAGYADAHYQELIHKYKPDIIWNDISYPEKGDELGLFADYFNTVPDGLINDRWSKHNELANFKTPEYKTSSFIEPHKWEVCRGLGYSFGFSKNETDKEMLSSDSLVRLLIDVVSKNGNLLIGIGPDASGEISSLQLSRLSDLGKWLNINGEAIYSTKPCQLAQMLSTDSIPLRFTQSKDATYLFILNPKKNKELKIKDLFMEKNTSVIRLDNNQLVKWQQDGEVLTFNLPIIESKMPIVLKIIPKIYFLIK